MTDSTAPFSTFTDFAYRPLPESDPGSDQSMDGRMPQSIGQLIGPTWAEVESARIRCNRHANRLLFWQWWFVGMFTLYTTLVGILLLKLITGQ